LAPHDRFPFTPCPSHPTLQLLFSVNSPPFIIAYALPFRFSEINRTHPSPASQPSGCLVDRAQIPNLWSPPLPCTLNGPNPGGVLHPSSPPLLSSSSPPSDSFAQGSDPGQNAVSPASPLFPFCQLKPTKVSLRLLFSSRTSPLTPHLSYLIEDQSFLTSYHLLP